ncbi:peptidase associated/transthyretin-like domain-containing protein [Hymenobacter puniceus]|nr:hypothetical protein [Hymenobacter sp. BT190]MBC6697741.1 hypothetical protein [Hymenobacter sp. BT190]
MNARPLLLAIGLLALSTSCDKEPDTTTIEGQVVDRINGQPVPNATVQLHVTPNTGAGAYRAVGAPHACDAQGRFSFAAEAPGGHVILMAHSA